MIIKRFFFLRRQMFYSILTWGNMYVYSDINIYIGIYIDTFLHVELQLYIYILKIYCIRYNGQVTINQSHFICPFAKPWLRSLAPGMPTSTARWSTKQQPCRPPGIPWRSTWGGSHAWHVARCVEFLLGQGPRGERWKFQEPRFFFPGCLTYLSKILCSSSRDAMVKFTGRFLFLSPFKIPGVSSDTRIVFVLTVDLYFVKKCTSWKLFEHWPKPLIICCM